MSSTETNSIQSHAKFSPENCSLVLKVDQRLGRYAFLKKPVKGTQE
jgi:hypothetical protein